MLASVTVYDFRFSSLSYVRLIVGRTVQTESSGFRKSNLPVCNMAAGTKHLLPGTSGALNLP